MVQHITNVLSPFHIDIHDIVCFMIVKKKSLEKPKGVIRICKSKKDNVDLLLCH